MKIVLALGGNALLKPEQKGSIHEQIETIKSTSEKIIEVIKEGHQIIITHGNGPQIGILALKDEISKDKVPSMPLDVLGAKSQGWIGYLLQQQLKTELRKNDVDIPIVSLLTQVTVKKEDKAFKNPKKPIGPSYSNKEINNLSKEREWVFKKTEKGYRRVVASPNPIKILEINSIKKLLNSNHIVIACGGGGIPVVSNGGIKGVEAVIDKDLTSALLATEINAECLLILTDVKQVYLNYNKPNQKPLKKINIEEANEYLKEGHFPSGSMGPKIKACINFLENGGEEAIIASLRKIKEALNERSGTIITK